MEKKGKERLDQFLAKKMDVSRSKIQKLISEGKVLVDGKTVSASFLVDYENDIEVNDDLNYEITVFFTSTSILWTSPFVFSVISSYNFVGKNLIRE